MSAPGKTFTAEHIQQIGAAIEHDKHCRECGETSCERCPECTSDAVLTMLRTPPPAAPPKRRFTVELNASGDTWDDVARALQDLLPHIEEHGPKCDSVSGGPSSGHWVRVTEDQEMTHERYHQALDEYLEKRRG